MDKYVNDFKTFTRLNESVIKNDTSNIIKSIKSIKAKRDDIFLQDLRNIEIADILNKSIRQFRK